MAFNRVNPAVEGIVPPPIDVFNRKISELRSCGMDVINLAQGVSDIDPPMESVEAAVAAISGGQVHRYSHDAGLPEAREAVARWLSRKSVHRDPDSELLLTAGASQAFFAALQTLVAPGEKVLLPAPCYFDHLYAVLSCGCVPVEVDLLVKDGRWVFDVPSLLHKAGDCRALVLVSPNNPTGAVMEPSQLEELAAGLTGTDVVVISDETYDGIVYDGAVFASPASIQALAERTVVVGSFSKTLGLAGWRIGYLSAPGWVVEQALKIQDSMIICAPLPAQVAVTAALRRDCRVALEYLQRLTGILDGRRRVLQRGLAGLEAFQWFTPGGSFFAFVGIRVESTGETGDTSGAGVSYDEHLAMSLLEEAGVALMPGSAFGRAGRGYFRISFGNVPEDRLEEACRRMGAFFGR